MSKTILGDSRSYLVSLLTGSLEIVFDVFDVNVTHTVEISISVLMLSNADLVNSDTRYLLPWLHHPIHLFTSACAFPLICERQKYYFKRNAFPPNKLLSSSQHQHSQLLSRFTVTTTAARLEITVIDSSITQQLAIQLYPNTRCEPRLSPRVLS